MASVAGSTFIRDSVCGAPCEKAGPLSAAAMTAAPASVIERIIVPSIHLISHANWKRLEPGSLRAQAFRVALLLHRILEAADGVLNLAFVVPFNSLVVKDKKMVLPGTTKISLKGLPEFKYNP